MRNLFRKGSSLPTPFWMMTMVVFLSSTPAAICSGTVPWVMALCAQTI